MVTGTTRFGYLRALVVIALLLVSGLLLAPTRKTKRKDANQTTESVLQRRTSPAAEVDTPSTITVPFGNAVPLPHRSPKSIFNATLRANSDLKIRQSGYCAQHLQKSVLPDDEWANAVYTGRAYWCIASMAIDQATQYLSQLEKWRNTPFRALELNTDDDQWHYEELKHDRKWSGGAPTNDGYDTFFSKDVNRKTIVVHQMFSPSFTNKEQGTLSNTLPPLQQWSDLVFLNYYWFIATKGLFNVPNVNSAGGSKIPCPKSIIIPDIVTPATREMIQTVWERDQKPAINYWPGVKYEQTPDGDEPFAALLSTPHGRAVSTFLWQHKQQLGINMVNSITIWQDYVGKSNIIFEINSNE